MSDRRDFIKNLAAGSIAGVPAVKSIERIDLKPDDALVITVPGRITQETAERLKAAVQENLPGIKVLVLGDGMEMKAIRKSDA